MTGHVAPPSETETLELQIRFMSAYLDLKVPEWRSELAGALDREYDALERML